MRSEARAPAEGGLRRRQEHACGSSTSTPASSPATATGRRGQGRSTPISRKLIPHHPLVDGALADLAAGKTLDAGDPQRHGRRRGGALRARRRRHAGKGDELAALIYLRLALFLRPDHDLAAVTVANLFEDLKQNDEAIAAYELVPADSPMRESAEIQAALELDALGRIDDAIKRLQEIVAAHPKDVDAWSALGSLQRSAKKYEDAAATYDKAIALVGTPDRSNWTLFYFRGICFERSKQWPKAEADFKKALELYPDQPLVLNYLGYSWVDQGVNLDEAFKMLRRAVDLQAERRLYRRQPRLGALQARPLPGGDRGSSKRRSISSRPIPSSTTISATPIGASTAASKRISSGTTRATWSPEPEDLPKILEEDRRTACPTSRPRRRRRRPPPPRARRRAAAARLGESLAAASGARPAKVNLTLHVLGRRTDGWHELDSVVAFAGCCDWLAFEPAETLSLTIDGPTAAAAGPTDDNLVLRRGARARRTRSAASASAASICARVLPVAAGLGGGSTRRGRGAARARRRQRPRADDERLFAAARAIGADVPVCLRPSARRMAGPRRDGSVPRFDCRRCSPCSPIPSVAVATPAVFAALGLAPGASLDAPPAAAARAPARTRRARFAALEAGRNDLQASATRSRRRSATTLEALRRLDGARLARMSGSGATCFALFDDRHAAARAARALCAAHPGWWVRATCLR